MDQLLCLMRCLDEGDEGFVTRVRSQLQRGSEAQRAIRLCLVAPLCPTSTALPAAHYLAAALSCEAHCRAAQGHKTPTHGIPYRHPHIAQESFCNAVKPGTEGLGMGLWGRAREAYVDAREHGEGLPFVPKTPRQSMEDDL